MLIGECQADRPAAGSTDRTVGLTEPKQDGHGEDEVEHGAKRGVPPLERSWDNPWVVDHVPGTVGGIADHEHQAEAGPQRYNSMSIDATATGASMSMTRKRPSARAKPR